VVYALRRHGEAWLGPPGRIDHEARVRLPELAHLFAAAGAVMVLVPEAVHRRAQEADPHHEGHHASHNRCQARL